MAYNKDTDRYSKTVINALYSLMKAQFTNFPVVYFNDFRSSDIALKREYIRFYLNDDTSEGNASQMNYRVYNFNASYYIQSYSDQQKKTYEGNISQRINELYYLLMSNRSYEPSTGYKWHHIEIDPVGGVEWGFDGENESIGHIDLTFSVYRGNQFEIAEQIIVSEEIVIE